jgi:MPBQ/MSBQ methyltransferase
MRAGQLLQREGACGRGIAPSARTAAPACSGRSRRRCWAAAGPSASDAGSEAILAPRASATAAGAGRELYQLSEAACCSSTASTSGAPAASVAGIDPSILAAVAGLGLTLYAVKRVLDTPSRKYDNNVGQEYDAWTEEGVLEYYWGEHIHLGYYTDEELAQGYLNKNFKQAKFDFVDKMLEFSGAKSPKKILDVGCGFGGTSRHLAKKFREAQVTGAHPCRLMHAASCRPCGSIDLPLHTDMVWRLQQQ